MFANPIAQPARTPSVARTVRLASALALGGYALFFVVGFAHGHWLYDALWRPAATDFLNVWAAGDLALRGDAAAAYDWGVHKQVENAALGYDFPGYFGWHYPPPFLLVAAPLALIAYPVAQLFWMAVTAPLYVAAIRAIAPYRGAAAAALAFPAAAWNFGCGQNGFLTAALLGAGLLMLERRPVLAGVLIGLLTYKPQFGLLIPLALVACGSWRTIAAACVTALAIAALATAAFGTGVWTAFLGSTAVTNDAVLVEGWADFVELLSPFGASRWLGAGVAGAWIVQGITVAGLGVVVWRAWRGAGAFADRAALLVAATLVSSPYIYVYDLTALAVAIAFLARGGVTERERFALGVACLLVLGGPQTGLPLAALAAPAVAAVAVARLARATPLRTPSAAGRSA